MRVVDGDSIEADVRGFGRLSIRLANVDAPEHDQPWGREAGEALARLVRGGRPEFRLLYRDQYARVVGLVSVRGVVVNEQLVRDGHAWAYDRRLPAWLRARYKGFERTARDSGAGLWGSRAKPIPPGNGETGNEAAVDLRGSYVACERYSERRRTVTEVVWR